MAKLIFDWLVLGSGAASAGIICVALLRQPLRSHFGAVAMMWLWCIVPIAVLSLAIPKTSVASFIASPAPVSELVSNLTTPAALVKSLDWRECVLWMWSAGFIAFVLRAALQQHRFVRRITWPNHRRGVLPAGEEPSVVGILFPRIALPVDFRSRYTPGEQKLVLLHEHTHIARFDGLVNLGTQAGLCLQWFNPLAHWACGAIGRDQELACDAVVASRHPSKLKVYAAAMLKAAERHRSHLPLVSQWNSYHPTVERIAMLSQHRKEYASHKLASVTLIFAGVLASALVYAARPETINYKRLNISPDVAVPTATVPAVELDAAKSNLESRKKISVGDQGSKLVALAKQLRDASEVAEQKPVDDAAQQPNYLMKFAFTLAKSDGASPPMVSTKKIELSMIIADSGRFVYEMPGDTQISMVAKQKDDKILFQAVIESIAEQKVIAQPSIVVAPGAMGSIRVGSSNERGLIDGFEFDVTVTPISAEEAEALRSKPRPQPPTASL